MNAVYSETHHNCLHLPTVPRKQILAQTQQRSVILLSDKHNYIDLVYSALIR